MLIVMDQSTHEEHFSQPFQTNNKQINLAVTFLTVYKGTFTALSSKNKFFFAKSITDKDGFIQRTIPPGAYEIEFLNDGIKRIIFEQGQFLEADYPFTITPMFSTLVSFIEISRQESLVSFPTDERKRNRLGLNASTIYEENNLSHIAVEILSFDNIFFNCNIARGMTFKGRRSRKIHNLTMDVSPGYK